MVLLWTGLPLDWFVGVVITAGSSGATLANSPCISLILWRPRDLALCVRVVAAIQPTMACSVC
jgi:hypothetical protein